MVVTQLNQGHATAQEAADSRVMLQPQKLPSSVDRVIQPTQELEHAVPNWKDFNTDEIAIKNIACRSFTQSLSKVIIRQRVSDRLTKLHDAIQATKGVEAKCIRTDAVESEQKSSVIPFQLDIDDGITPDYFRLNQTTADEYIESAGRVKVKADWQELSDEQVPEFTIGTHNYATPIEPEMPLQYKLLDYESYPVDVPAKDISLTPAIEADMLA